MPKIGNRRGQTLIFIFINSFTDLFVYINRGNVNRLTRVIKKCAIVRHKNTFIDLGNMRIRNIYLVTLEWSVL